MTPLHQGRQLQPSNSKPLKSVDRKLRTPRESEVMLSATRKGVTILLVTTTLDLRDHLASINSEQEIVAAQADLKEVSVTTRFYAGS